MDFNPKTMDINLEQQKLISSPIRVKIIYLLDNQAMTAKLADMINSRFDAKKVRATAALNTITIVIFYMIAQLVGAGALIKLLFGIDYWLAVLIVGVMMTVYVLFGGMTATSWVQIIKAVLLMLGTIIISFLVLSRFHFNIFEMFSTMKTATPLGEAYLNPGVKYKVPLDTLSLMIALVFGTAGLPHILIFEDNKCRSC